MKVSWTDTVLSWTLKLFGFKLLGVGSCCATCMPVYHSSFTISKTKNWKNNEIVCQINLINYFLVVGTKHQSHQDYMERADKARSQRLSSGSSSAKWYSWKLSVKGEDFPWAFWQLKNTCLALSFSFNLGYACLLFFHDKYGTLFLLADLFKRHTFYCYIWKTVLLSIWFDLSMLPPPCGLF